MDVRLIAAQKYASAKPITEPNEAEGDLGNAFRGTAANFVETLRHAEDTARAAMVGDADPHSLVQALTQSELAVETIVTVRDRVVEAYQEILRMPV